MKISLIAAMDKNRVIGKDNDIPWRIPKDWEFVKEKTVGKTIIMGRKNLESIGRALPNRRNIVLTRDRNFSYEGCEVVHSVDEVFKVCKEDEEVFIFGGEQVYKLFMGYVEYMYITKIDYEFEGDTYFPEVDFSEWEEVSVQKGVRNKDNPYDYSFHEYKRKEVMENEI